jgi:hypothetical protein
MKPFLSLSLLSLLSLAISCGPAIDPMSVKARKGAPLAAQVDEVQKGRNHSLPLAYLVVEPVRVTEAGKQNVTSMKGQVGMKGGKLGANAEGELSIIKASYRSFLLSRQRQISLQLTSALSGVGDFRLIDYESYTDEPEKFKVQKEALGPYFVRAVITECDERIVSDKRRLTLPLVYRNKKNLVEGVVGLDISVISTSSGELVAGFPSVGSFISRTSSSDTGLIFSFAKSETRMKSTIEQALRVALNDAALKLHDRLYTD